MAKRTLGSRIKQARQALGLSQPALGRKLRRSAITVYRWESGRAVPSVTTLQRVAAVLEVTLTELIEDQVA